MHKPFLYVCAFGVSFVRFRLRAFVCVHSMFRLRAFVCVRLCFVCGDKFANLRFRFKTNRFHA